MYTLCECACLPEEVYGFLRQAFSLFRQRVEGGVEVWAGEGGSRGSASVWRDRQREGEYKGSHCFEFPQRDEREVGVGWRRYYVSSDVEWSILVMGHQEGGGGGWREGGRKRGSEREREKETVVSNLQFPE